MDQAMTRSCDDLERAAGRLRFLAAHDALILLRASFSAPKLLHTLHASPCSGHPTLEKFDGLLRKCVSQICNTDLTDLQWIQACLYQYRMAAWGSDVCRRLHLLPFWHQLRAHVISKTKSAKTTYIDRLRCQPGPGSLVSQVQPGQCHMPSRRHSRNPA